MGLKIVWADDLHCEMFVCDHCGRKIDDHRDAIGLWYPPNPIPEGLRMHYHTVCKATCVEPFEARNGHAHSSEIVLSIIHLMNNLKVSIEDLEEEMRWVH